MDHNHRDRGDACLRLLAAGGFSSSAHSDSRLGRGLGAGRPGRLGSRADPVRQVVFHSREGDGTGHERDLLKDSEPGVRFWNSSDRWHHPVDRVTGVALGASWGFANAGDTGAEGGASSGGEIWGSVPSLSGANLVLSRPLLLRAPGNADVVGCVSGHDLSHAVSAPPVNAALAAGWKRRASAQRETVEERIGLQPWKV